MGASGKAKIGVVAVPFITNEFQFNVAARTVVSLLAHKIEHDLELIAVVNSIRTGQPHFDWFKRSFDVCEVNDRNILARGWNRGIDIAFARGADYCLVINLDLVFHPRFIDNLVEFARQNPDALMWSGVPWEEEETLANADLSGPPIGLAHFHCFMIDRRLFELIGRFDEQFEPAYHEDSDMIYRMRLKGARLLATPSARIFHHDRITLKGAMMDRNDEMLIGLRAMMNLSMERYKAKWGGLPGEEQFTAPYNGALPVDVKK
jgi:GT2 family glycosyltransferase